MKAHLAVTALIAVTLSACTSSQQDDAIDAADRFVTAVSEGDGAAACALLGPVTRTELEESTQKPCDQAVLEEAKEAGERVDATTYGTMSEVRYAEDVLFLNRYQDGWRVLAAACTPQPGDAPYDCQIKGR